MNSGFLFGHNDSHLCSQLTNLIKEVGMQHVGTVFVALTQIKTEQCRNEAAVIVGMKASPRSYVLS